MHELSIAMSIVDMAQEEAERRKVYIDAVHLELGLSRAWLRKRFFFPTK